MKIKGNKAAQAGICLLAIALGSCGRSPRATEAPPTRVKLMAVHATEQTSGRSYSGTVEAASGTTLSFSVGGTIQSMSVSVGDFVGRGQLVATLDAATLRNTHEMAVATLAQAQDAYDRMRQLHDANALPDIKWVEVENALSQARSAEAIARRALADAALYAPAAGYIAEKIADTGMNVAPGMPVVKVVDIASVKVGISIPENEIASVCKGLAAVISVGALDGKTYSGRLTEKGVTANPLSRSYDVKFEVPNPGRDLLPGMICDVTLVPDTVAEVIAVPIDAVLLDADNRNFVWLAKGGRAEKRTVVTGGLTASTEIIVSSGLADGDSVIVSGQQKVSQGTPVADINR